MGVVAGVEVLVGVEVLLMRLVLRVDALVD